MKKNMTVKKHLVLQLTGVSRARCNRLGSSLSPTSISPDVTEVPSLRKHHITLKNINI